LFLHLLIEFLFRLSFGIAAAMTLTSSRQVTSGFFRVHLWLVMGLQTLDALVLGSIDTNSTLSWVGRGRFWLAVAAAIGSYIGAVIWMYERPRLGKAAIVFVAACAIGACWLPAMVMRNKPIVLELADQLTGGLVLGSVMTAMLLGHWYLNSPTMKLEPLKRLLVLIVIAVALRAAVCLPGGMLETARLLSSLGAGVKTWGLFLALRWLSGVVGVLGLTWLTWQTLKIPNTQSATGILYASTVLALIGELMSELLSAGARYPV
jgi:hypothetical protein